MRATSHQLKTPIAASMLLVDGMIGKVESSEIGTCICQR